jgi:tight adherence protein B
MAIRWEMQMDSSELLLLGLLALAAISVAVVVYISVVPYLSGERQMGKRIQGVTDNKTTRLVRSAANDAAQNRRKQVAETIKELEERQKAKEKVTMRLRLQRAGLSITPNVFLITSLVCGAVMGSALFLSNPNFNLLVPLSATVVGALGVPRWVLNKLTSRRQRKFTAEFANAIDIIVRGVKSGLPLNECLAIIARESPEPLASEFKEVVEQQRVGVPLSEAFERMMMRMPLSEVRFFAIVIGIQQQAGGNLSEALGNLSGVLRDRKRLQAKVRALSAEAKASAAVLGALPFVVMALVYISTPNYIALLWTKTFGKFMLACAAFWMTIGVLVMRKMINFKY